MDAIPGVTTYISQIGAGGEDEVLVKRFDQLRRLVPGMFFQPDE